MSLEMQRLLPIVGWTAAVLAFAFTGPGAVFADPGVGGAPGVAATVPMPRANLVWRPVADGQRGRRVAALAVEPGRDRIAIGDDQGARLGPPGGVMRRVLHRGPVRDLVFLPEGSLLAATERGLYRIDGSGPTGPVAPGPGESARSVRRVAVLAGLGASPGIAVAATDAGLFASLDGRAWQRLTGALPTGPATAVALGRAVERAVCWAVIAGQLWRVDLELRDVGIGVASAKRAVIAFAGRDRGAVDVTSELPGTQVAVVFPKTIAFERAGESGSGWEIVRPQLPAGAELLRIGTGAGGVWLASDRGLLVASTLRGPWRRASAPVGTSAVQAAVGTPGAIYVAATAGIFGARVASGSTDADRAGRFAQRAPPIDGPRGAATAARLALAPDPPVAEVHRVAVGYLGLGRTRLEALRRGVHRRGWWPIVAVRADSDWDRSRTTDHDQSFLSGEVRHLTDRDLDHGDSYGVSLTLSWDLGDIVYEPEVIDVSRETREVIELRDDVLDEITQLYFERRRVLAALGADSPAADAMQLRLRAAELAAGIDAWTGGWFSERVNAPTP